MRKIVLHLAAAAAVLATLAHATPAMAQSDILLRLRSGSPLGDRFRVDSAGGVVAKSNLGIGLIPQSGAGDRMMWHPFKAAFRAGGVDLTNWDDANVGFYSLAGGWNTLASGYYSFAAGYDTEATANYATVTGYQSWAHGVGSVAMGYLARATGAGAVSIGTRTTADADYSVAIGQRASANGHAGAIVFADQSTTDSLEASANNQFSVRAAGGYRLYTNATTTTGMSMNAGGSSWNVISDRNRKQDFLAVDGEDLLGRLRAIPVTTWRYRDEADRTVRHIGPMAQDWARAFGFSSDNTTINMSDFDGVNLAAVQALETRTAQQARQLGTQAQEIQALRGENAELRAQNRALEERMQRLEALVAGSRAP
ncbi:MAG TPA: tail fiber domain-containing protein [Longimicrobium sp.]|nr:tail fiber domain-containing protein [Longimicrobium sp.]